MTEECWEDRYLLEPNSDDPYEKWKHPKGKENGREGEGRRRGEEEEEEKRFQ